MFKGSQRPETLDGTPPGHMRAPSRGAERKRFCAASAPRLAWMSVSSSPGRQATLPILARLDAA